jgi:pyruvate dehydrogenase E2 component (dihydrolipoamide acetyltransferase)
MRYIFNFPDIGEGLEEGIILEWYVQKGQTIKAGDSLVKMETDKVVADIPSPKAGIIVALFGNTGEVIHVGSPLIEIDIEGVFAEEAVALANAPQVIEPEEQEAAAGVVGTMELAGNNAFLPASDENTVKKEAEVKAARKVLATPLARAMAKDLKIDINQITGSGPSGRVSKTDIENFKPANRPVGKPDIIRADDTDEVTYEPLSQIRKAIARNMLNSKQNTAHMTIFEEVEISDLIRIRGKYKKIYQEKEAKLTYLPFIVKAVVQALKRHRQLNSQIDMENERMIYKNRYNIAIAVDSPEGLVVPVIKDADRLSIFEIAQKITELSGKAKERKLTLDEMKDGTFTITNYGSIGGIFATPVINYPQAAILGVGRIMKKPVVKEDQIVVGNVLALSLSVDHRIVDGGEASRFVNKIMEYLSDPVSLLME